MTRIGRLRLLAGLVITLPAAPASTLVTYRRAR